MWCLCVARVCSLAGLDSVVDRPQSDLLVHTKHSKLWRGFLESKPKTGTAVSKVGFLLGLDVRRDEKKDVLVGE